MYQVDRLMELVESTKVSLHRAVTVITTSTVVHRCSVAIAIQPRIRRPTHRPPLANRPSLPDLLRLHPTSYSTLCAGECCLTSHAVSFCLSSTKTKQGWRRLNIIISVIRQLSKDKGINSIARWNRDKHGSAWNFLPSAMETLRQKYPYLSSTYLYHFFYSVFLKCFIMF